MTEQFGPYRLGGLLGRGGMGEVHRAIDSSRGNRVVALKRLHPGLGGHPDLVDRFRRESAVVASLNNPHIVPLLDFGEIDGRLFLAMALMDGVDLATLIRQGGWLAPDRAVAIVGQVAKALAAAHRSGVSHRDVKPSNVLVVDSDGDDHAYLIDFGIAQVVDATRLTASGALVGTLAYMAPERFAGESDHRSDVYALGCVLHECLAGSRPFPQRDAVALIAAHGYAPPPRPTSHRPELPPALDGVVATALAKDPAARYPSALALAAAAEAALTRPADVPAPASARPGRTPAGPARARVRRAPVVVAVALIAMLAVPVGVVVGSTPTALDEPPTPFAVRAGTVAAAPATISPAMKAAPVAILDRWFYQHNGVRWTGGTTLTERYVRNYRLHVAAETDGDRRAALDQGPLAWLRVVRAALSIEAELTKDDILAGFLNTVYLGNGAYGVEAAGRTYFDTTPDALTLPQAALLAGLADDPVTFDPVTHPAAARDRRNAVLAVMTDLQMIDDEQRAEASATPLGLVVR